jgi:hypothetical protein
VSEALRNDPLQLAHQKCLDILESVKSFEIEEDKSKAIDKGVEAASKELTSIKGAME